MGSIPPELSLDLVPTHVPKSIRNFLKEISPIGDSPLKAEKVGDFIRRLEDEMRKIEGFKRELPLCMLLLEDAIQFLKEESTQSSAPNVEPVLEEFIPLKKDLEEDADINRERDCMKDKMNWMSSVQLWKNDGVRPGGPHQKLASALQAEQVGPLINEESEDPLLHCKRRVAERAFVPFKGCPSFPAVSIKEDHGEDLPTAGLSLLTPGTRSPTSESGLIDLSSELSCTKTARSNVHPVTQPLPTNQNTRKQRRCWSPELHRRFVNALQQLGGSQVATPKQIKELMQVDGLTNDEVKSHLQKYRLHTRRHPGHPSSPGANQPVVVLGGLWMAPENHYSGSPKGSSSGSPQGPLQLTGNASFEDEEDDRSESFGWKSRVPKLGKVDV